MQKLNKPVNEELKCSKCDFTSLSKQGLKTHTKRKHTVADAENCDFWGPNNYTTTMDVYFGRNFSDIS